MKKYCSDKFSILLIKYHEPKKEFINCITNKKIK